MKFGHTLMAATFAVLASAAASAATVDITNITGFWQFAVPPPPTTTINNSFPTSIISWGTPAESAQSSYTFTSLGNISIPVNPPPDSGNVQFGVFTHNNFPIFCIPGCLQSVQLMITADITVDGVPQGNKTFLADFQHDETPNRDNPCQFGGPPDNSTPGPNGVGINVNGCADRVLVTTITGGDTFIVNGTAYTLKFTGFSQDGGTTVSNTFYTIEDQVNIAGLYADVVVATIPVPEPGSLALVGLAALGVAGALRRKSTK